MKANALSYKQVVGHYRQTFLFYIDIHNQQTKTIKNILKVANTTSIREFLVTHILEIHQKVFILLESYQGDFIYTYFFFIIIVIYINKIKLCFIISYL